MKSSAPVLNQEQSLSGVSSQWDALTFASNPSAAPPRAALMVSSLEPATPQQCLQLGPSSQEKSWGVPNVQALAVF